jgi:hypothetical protein
MSERKETAGEAYDEAAESQEVPVEGFKPNHVAAVAKISEGELELRRDDAKEYEEDGRYYRQLYDWELRRRKIKELLEAEGK